MRSLPLLLVLLAGCTAELKEENNALQRTIDSQEKELAALNSENARLKLRVSDLSGELERRRLAESLGMRPGENLWALLETSRGEILCQLFPTSAPQTVANFVGLAEGTRPWADPRTGEKHSGVPFYDGTTFHRVLPEFMIQGGDRAGTGTGTPGYLIQDEIDPARKHEPGTLSMANTGAPNSGGSQFFITEVATPQLDGKHSVFGTCQPLAVVKEIARVPRDENDRPLEPVTLRRVTIHRGARPTLGE